jgi:hypothetical protein
MLWEAGKEGGGRREEQFTYVMNELRNVGLCQTTLVARRGCGMDMWHSSLT